MRVPGVMALLDDDVGDGRAVLLGEHEARGSNALELFAKDLSKLAFGDAVAVDDDALWLLRCGLVEGDEALTDRVKQVDHRLAALALHLHVSAVGLRQAVQVAHNLNPIMKAYISGKRTAATDGIPWRSSCGVG